MSIAGSEAASGDGEADSELEFEEEILSLDYLDEVCSSKCNTGSSPVHVHWKFSWFAWIHVCCTIVSVVTACGIK